MPPEIAQERRTLRRLELTLPIRVWGTGQDGRPFFADGSTMDLSSAGVRFRIGRPPDPTRALLVYIAPRADDGNLERFRLRTTLEVLRVEAPAGGEADWIIAGRYRPEESEWLRVGGGG